MTQKLTRTELVEWCRRHGYTEDSYGHFKKEVQSKQTGETILYRFKLQDRSWRMEKQISIEHYGGRVEHRWVRVRSAYFGTSYVDPTTDKLMIEKSTL